MEAAITIKPIDLRAASDREYAAFNNLGNRIRAEQFPDDQPVMLDETIQELRNLPALMDILAWGAWAPDGSVLAGYCGLNIWRTEDNRHLAFLRLEVLPEYRRQGIGRQLIEIGAGAALREGRRMLMVGTNERIPAGEQFLMSLGASRGLESHTNQLKLADLDRQLLASWLERAHERASDFEIGCWDNAYPETELAAIADLNNVMNTAPRGNLDVEDWQVSIEELRQVEQMLQARGMVRWTFYARHRVTGAFAGFTEVVWHPNRPELLEQGGTGVFPEYRNHGLGRWLKAAMLEKVLRERPQVHFVRTGNADSNAPMLAINHQLGFKPYSSSCLWQVPAQQVLERLADWARQAAEAAPAQGASSA